MTFEDLCKIAADEEADSESFAQSVEFFISDASPHEVKRLRALLVRVVTE